MLAQEVIRYFLFSVVGLFLFSVARAEVSEVVTTQLFTYSFKLDKKQCSRLASTKHGLALIEVPLSAQSERKAFLMDEPLVVPETASNKVAIKVTFNPLKRKLMMQAYAVEGYKGRLGARADQIPPEEAMRACNEYVSENGREFSVQYLLPPSAK